MASYATLFFSCSRLRKEQKTCIEYSWVPTGVRHVIRLLPHQVIGVRTDGHADVSRVQVYSLRHGEYGQEQTSTGWQFPKDPAPQGKYLVGAVVHVVENYAHGYGLYDDGTSSPADVVELKPIVEPFDCGEGQSVPR